VQRQPGRAEPHPSEAVEVAPDQPERPRPPLAKAEPPSSPTGEEAGPDRPERRPEPDRLAESPSPPAVQRQVDQEMPVRVQPPTQKTEGPNLDRA
jgi:hypothetical protein